MNISFESGSSNNNKSNGSTTRRKWTAAARAPTGITAFDLMLNGGFMKGDSVLVTGAAGTGKTNMALQFLYNGVVKFGENGIYVTFEEMPDQIYRDALSIGMDLEKLESENKLRVISTSPEILAKNRDLVFDPSFAPNKKVERVVVDSISYFGLLLAEGMAGNSGNNIRDETYSLIRYLKTKGITSLLIHEAQSSSTSSEMTMIQNNGGGIHESGLSFLADCVVVLKYVEIESAIRRALAILKMRGSDHNKLLREVRITSAGFDVGDSFEQWEGVLSGTPRKSFGAKVSKAFGGI
jgi:circadian clock protein KaiC